MYLLLKTVKQESLVNMTLEKLLHLFKDQKKQQLYEEKF